MPRVITYEGDYIRYVPRSILYGPSAKATKKRCSECRSEDHLRSKCPKTNKNMKKTPPGEPSKSALRRQKWMEKGARTALEQLEQAKELSKTDNTGANIENDGDTRMENSGGPKQED